MGTLTPFLAPDGIRFFKKPVSKLQALDSLSEAVCSGVKADADRVRRAIREREELLNTGLGLGLALPHARLPELEEFSLSLGVCREGVDYGSLDGQPVRIMVLIVGPGGSHNEFVRFVAMVTGVLKKRAFRADVLGAERPGEVRRILERF